ncbi:MAG: hypothetical protein RO469_07040 [Thermincola sp.]|jgi:uncharacterized membrane protein YjfL (UPF0719 family)|nr:hypothetical protein [Thermincola sp.]MDT3702608.1 hypothetical protein [Thermincola sp.]
MGLTVILEIAMWGGFAGVIILMVWSIIHVTLSMTGLMGETSKEHQSSMPKANLN